MQDRPEAVELIESVRRFLEEELVPATEDPRLKFRTRIATNVLKILEREQRLEPALLVRQETRLRALLPEATAPGANAAERVAALEAILASSVRDGSARATPGTPLWDHLRQSVVEKLLVANPAYLERVGEAREANPGLPAKPG